MKIIVIADTHIPASAPEMPQKLFEYLKSCDMIIHAGDLIDVEVINKLTGLAQMKAVWGNMDTADVKKALPETLIFKADGKTVGVTHGSGSPENTLEKVKETFKGKKLDIVVFGHTHVPFNRTIEGTLYFNPGSVCDKIFAPYRSFGVIEITGNSVKAEIIRVDEQ